jgi:hypothetical protein
MPLLFKVISDGHKYEIYTDGRIVGFGNKAAVFNYFPQLVSRENALWSPTKRDTVARMEEPEATGREHSVPA